MEIIPLLPLEKRIGSNEQSDLLKDLSNIGAYKTIYILDYQGINKDKPNLCVFQRLSRDFDLWIDSGPRNLGDVVDLFLAGATAVTLRKKLWPNINIPAIREISENSVFMNIEKENIEEIAFYAVDGLINFNSREDIEKDYKFNQLIKQASLKNKLYSYEEDAENISYWKSHSIEKLLVDLNKIKEFNRYVE